MKGIVHLLFYFYLINNAFCNAGSPYRSYNTIPYCTPEEDFVYPSTVPEVQAKVRAALLRGKTVKALGATHSVTGIICTQGTPMRMKNFQQKRMNADGSVSLGAGVTLADALQFMKGHGRTFQAVPAYLGITMGGATGTGAHGTESTSHVSSLSDQIIQMKIVDGRGLLRTIQGRELDTFRVHLGLLGVVIEITFATVPLFKMIAQRASMPDDSLLDGSYFDMVKQHDFFFASWFPSIRQFGVRMGNFTSDLSLPGEAYLNFFSESSEATATWIANSFDSLHARRHYEGFKAAGEYGFLSITEKVNGIAPIHTYDGLTVANPAVGYYYDLVADGCSNCTWDLGLETDEVAIGVPVSQASEAARTILSIYGDHPFGLPFSGILLRYYKASNGVMSVASGGEDRLMFDMITVNTVDQNQPRAGIQGWHAIVQALIYKHGGRAHWAKGGEAYKTASMLRTQFPAENLNKFKAAMRRYDPFGVFHNKFSDRLLGKGEEVDKDPALLHCALRDACICGKDSDCGADQVCAEHRDADDIHTYKVCKDTLAYTNPPLKPYDPTSLPSIFAASS